MIDTILNNTPYLWEGALLLFAPISYYIVGKIIQKRKAANKPAVPAIIMRYLIIPTVVFHFALTKILLIPTTHVSIKVTVTILTIFFISFIINLFNYFIFSPENIFGKKESIPKLGRDIIHFILVTIAAALIMSNVWGLNLGNLLTALGVSSLVIGLALQEPLGNLFNGVSLLMAKPFQKGDWIMVGSDIGKIIEFNWRSLKFVTRENELVIIPNNLIGKEKIKNLSKPTKVHAEMVTVGFSYNDSPNDVHKVLIEAVYSVEKVLKKPEAVPVTLEYKDFYIEYGIKFYMKDYYDSFYLRTDVLSAIYYAAKKNSLTIPLPIRDIRVTSNDILSTKDMP